MTSNDNTSDQEGIHSLRIRPGEMFARWLVGIPDRSKSTTFKDVLDNIKNVGVLIAMSIVFGILLKDRALPGFIIFPVSVALMFLLLMIVLQSVAVFLLSSDQNYGIGFSKFINGFTLSVVLVVTLCASLTIYNIFSLVG